MGTWDTDERYGTNDYNGWGEPQGQNMYPGRGEPQGQNMYPHTPAPDMGPTIKAARKRFSMLGLMFFAGTIVIYGVQIIVSLAVQMFKPEWLNDGNISMCLSTLPLYLVGMPVLILLVKTIPAETVEHRRMKAGQFVLAAVICYAIVYISNIIGLIFTAVIGVLKGSPVQNQMADITESLSLWLIVAYMVICAPIMEEYIFRKLIVERTIRYGQGVAVLISGLMFGLFHGNLNQFVYAFTLGMFLAFLYVKTGKLKITIALHMMINFMGGVVSTGLMRLMDLEEYLNIAERMDMSEMRRYVFQHLPGWILYMAFICFVVGVTLAGGILLIVSLVKKKFVFSRGAVTLPKGRRFRTVMLNAGMIIYSVFWIGMIVLQLFL